MFSDCTKGLILKGQTETEKTAQLIVTPYIVSKNKVNLFADLVFSFLYNSFSDKFVI